jgi:hypothetical protein
MEVRIRPFLLVLRRPHGTELVLTHADCNLSPLVRTIRPDTTSCIRLRLCSSADQAMVEFDDQIDRKPLTSVKADAPAR